MLEQGFDDALCVGEADCGLPALLCRQSVVLGVSDGRILAKPPPTKPAQLRATMPQLPQQLLDGFQDLPLRNDLPTGEQLTFCTLIMLMDHSGNGRLIKVLLILQVNLMLMDNSARIFSKEVYLCALELCTKVEG